MKKSVFSPLLGALCLAALPVALTGAARAQDAAKPRTIYLYNASLGRAPASLNAAKSGPWGNGSIRDSRRVDYEGAPVLELTTRNLQEGARFDFVTPVDLDAYRDSGFLRLRLRFRENVVPGAEGVPGGVPGDPPPPVFLLKPRWNGSAQFGGALPPFGGDNPVGVPGDLTNPDGTGLPVVPQQVTPIKEIAVTLLRENGATAGRIPVDLSTQVADEDGWRLFVLPIKSLTSTPGASGRVKRAIFTSDAEDTFYLAQAALVIESGDITVSIRRPDDAAGAGPAEIEVKPGAVSLIADVEAGAADPIVEWNFDADNVGNLPPGALNVPAIPQGGEGIDPANPNVGFPGAVPGAVAGQAGVIDGPRLDARGLTATFEYPNEEQNYRVEVTVRDRSGVKKPVTSSILIKVRG